MAAVMQLSVLQFGEIAAIVCLNSILEIGGTKQVPRLQQLPDICSDQTENRR